MILPDWFAHFDAALSGYRPPLRPVEMGTVAAVGQGVARVRGLPGVAAMELVCFADDSTGIRITMSFGLSSLQFKPQGVEELTGQADKALYVKAIEDSKQMFTADGVMPEEGPATVLKVLRASDKSLQGKSINLANTFTTRFVVPGQP